MNETAPLTNDDWRGALWIKRACDDTDDYTYYRKTFFVQDKNIERATLYVSAVHKYELYLNAHLIGKGPSYHSPPYQYYNAYDITTQLVPNAQNTFAVFTHWFGAGQGRPASARGMILKTNLEYADGAHQIVCSDGTWKQTCAECWVLGQPLRNDEGVGYVEKIDAAKIMPNWFAREYDESAWEYATEIGAHPTEPWTGILQLDISRIVEYEIAPVSITAVISSGARNLGFGERDFSQRRLEMTNPPEIYVVDLGKVYAGRPRIIFSGGRAGQLITICGGYALRDEGTIDADKNQNTDMTFYAIANGGAFTFLPCEYLGMRYVQIENAPMPITRENFSFIVRHAELDASRSAFTSSHPTLNAVWDLCKHSVTLGAQEQFLDTPTREKGGFLVDSMNESLAAMFAYGERVLTRKTLREFLQSMEQYWDGRINSPQRIANSTSVELESAKADLALGCRDFNPQRIANSTSVEESAKADLAMGCRDFNPQRIANSTSVEESAKADLALGCRDFNRPYEGRLNAVFPNGDGARDIPDFTQAYLVWVWEYYLQTGDKIFLRENYAKLKSIAEYVHRHRNTTTRLIHQLRGGGGEYLHGIVDWPPSMRYGYDMQTDARTVINCYAYADYEIISNIAAELGNADDCEIYAARANDLKNAINHHLLRDVYVDGLYENGSASAHASQHANMFPLALGIVPPEKRAQVLQHVKNLKMSVGMVTVYWLVRALGEMDAGEHLLNLYTNAEWDGWAKCLERGATCTWESWDADQGGNLSQSHPWGAVGLCGIQQYILGVKPLAPQYARAQIKPLDFGNALKFVQGRVPTERGEIFVRWQRSEKSFAMTLELPANVQAKMCVPRGNFSNARIVVDGERANCVQEENYFVIEGIDSGKHTVELWSKANELAEF